MPDGAPADDREAADLVPPSAQSEGNKPLPLQLELPAARRPAQAAAEVDARVRPRPWQVRRLAIAALGALVCLAAVAAATIAWAFPWYVRRECIEFAALHDVNLEVDDAKVDAAGFHLMGVRAAFAQIPGAHAQAPVVDVQTSALRPHKMTVHGAELALNGPAGQLLGDFAKWRASLTAGPSAPWGRARLIVEGARVLWRAPIDDGLRVEAGGVNAELRPTELHVRSDHVTVGVAGGVFGPWRVDADRLPASSRVRVALDPGVPEASTILVVADSERTMSVDVVVPRSPLEHLGVPGSLIGLDPRGIQLEVDVHYAALGPTRADARATGSLHGVELPRLLGPRRARPLDVAWEATVSGDASAGIDVRKARLAVGPLVGPLTGTLKRFEDGFRIDLSWAAGPVPCDAFAVPLGLGQPFDIAYALRKLGEASRPASHGSADMAGTVSASVMISFDSRDPNTAKIDFVPQVGCSG